MARPTDDPKTFRLDLRFSPEMVDRIDDWRRVRRQIPARSEAIRHLIERGLMFDSFENGFFGLLSWVSRNIPENLVSEEEMSNLSKIIEPPLATSKDYADRLEAENKVLISVVEKIKKILPEEAIKEMIENIKASGGDPKFLEGEFSAESYSVRGERVAESAQISKEGLERKIDYIKDPDGDSEGFVHNVEKPPRSLYPKPPRKG